MEADRSDLPLTCPSCGKPLAAREDDGVGTMHFCADEDLFWIDGHAFEKKGSTLGRHPTLGLLFMPRRPHRE
jgi:hypothetical protein